MFAIGMEEEERRTSSTIHSPSLMLLLLPLQGKKQHQCQGAAPRGMKFKKKSGPAISQRGRFRVTPTSREGCRTSPVP